MSLSDEDVLKIVSKLKKSLEQENHSLSEDLLKQLEKFTPTTERLKKTKVGVFLTNEVRKHEKANENVKNLAKDLVNQWKKDIQAPSPAHPVKAEKPEKIEKKSLLKVDVEKKPAPLKRAPTEPSIPATPASATDDTRTVKSDGVRPKYPGDGVRDKCLDLLYKAMASNTTEDSQRVLKVAEQVEQYTYQSFDQVGEPYKARIRTEVMNLQNKTHPELRMKVLSGEITAKDFAVMPVEEMASKERQDEIAAEKKKAAHDAVVGKPVQQTTDMFLCGRCKQRKCTYFQMQTRSADEPMTTFVTCTYCGHKWKFC
ncbi:Transcription elongation factor A protein 1 [Rhizophlyctis rosea]|uniref:Transcription elongation factor n=1 Tax=Rhizophlyctis rosea TaxID=64517 RepID=A0AAD5X927_9FUNG|nr:Transcription elongation factor A protein 1 [Rhizophlyctis rosea]